MRNIKQILELEYRYLIPKAKVYLKPPVEVSNFKLEDYSVTEHEDLLFERKGTSMKSENVGIRMRKKSDLVEYTYKKFLGRVGGVVNYDELTVPISKKQWVLAQQGMISSMTLPRIDELRKKGDIYPLFLLKNKRHVYNYIHGKSKIELVLEDITYRLGSKTAKDYMLEAEININEDDKQILDLFMKEICSIYGCQDLNEGKNARAERLLGAILK